MVLCAECGRKSVYIEASGHPAEFCSNLCRKTAVDKRHVPACVKCGVYPRVLLPNSTRSLYCSKSCSITSGPPPPPLVQMQLRPAYPGGMLGGMPGGMPSPNPLIIRAQQPIQRPPIQRPPIPSCHYCRIKPSWREPNGVYSHYCGRTCMDAAMAQSNGAMRMPATSAPHVLPSQHVLTRSQSISQSHSQYPQCAQQYPQPQYHNPQMVGQPRYPSIGSPPICNSPHSSLPNGQFPPTMVQPMYSPNGPTHRVHKPIDDQTPPPPLELSTKPPPESNNNDAQQQQTINNSNQQELVQPPQPPCDPSLNDPPASSRSNDGAIPEELPPPYIRNPKEDLYSDRKITRDDSFNDDDPYGPPRDNANNTRPPDNNNSNNR